MRLRDVTRFVARLRVCLRAPDTGARYPKRLSKHREWALRIGRRRRGQCREPGGRNSQRRQRHYSKQLWRLVRRRLPHALTDPPFAFVWGINRLKLQVSNYGAAGGSGNKRGAAMLKNTVLSGLGGIRSTVRILPLLIIAAIGLVPASPRATTNTDERLRVQVSEAYARLPLSFEANRGQTDGRVEFLAHGAGHTLFLTRTEAVLVLTTQQRLTDVTGPSAQLASRESGPVTRTNLRMTFVGANPAPRMSGREELPGKANYFIGNDPAKWRTNVPTYAKVGYDGLYPGIDLVYYSTQRHLEYDFVIRPGADPTGIVLGFDGIHRVEVDAQGELVLHTAAGAIRQRKPLIYQELRGRRIEVPGGYVLKRGRQVGFEVAAYDRSRPLVIDPVLVYSTYLGGNAFDKGFGIAIDALGNAYVTGQTRSTDFPATAGAFQTAHRGAVSNAFVTKLNATGSAVLYSTYLGGSDGSADLGIGIAVDPSGAAYVTGRAGSTDFPTTPGAFRTTTDGGFADAFVTKLNPAGSGLVYSTYLGGSAFDIAFGIAVNTAGNAYVVGETESTDFPATAGAFQTTSAAFAKGFVTKLNAAGSALVYSTYLGGSNTGETSSIAVDASGNAYVTGDTASTDFPITAGAFQTTAASLSFHAFVTKLNALGSNLVYSTYLGGTAQEFGVGIVVDALGQAYVTGVTNSTDFPTTPGAFQTVLSGNGDAFVTKLNAAGSALVYSTYLGGTSVESGASIAVDAFGHAYVTGATASSDFPSTSGAFHNVLTAFASHAFVTKLNLTGATLVYSTYLGGNSFEAGSGIAVDASGTAYVTGATESTNFPTTPGAFQTTFGGGTTDGFLAKIATSPVEQLTDLETLIPSSGLPAGTENSLLAKVGAAAEALAQGNTTAACNQLQALINAAGAQANQHPTEAAAIIAAAQATRTALGCP